jgi:hypothetical protein
MSKEQNDIKKKKDSISRLRTFRSNGSTIFEDLVLPEREEYEYLVGEDSDWVSVENVAVPKSGERAPDLDASDE